VVKRIFHFITNREKMKKLMDWLAYGSLFMDICITIITLSSIFYPSNLGQYLGSVNILLSIVVILSIASAVMMIGSKIYEIFLFRTFKLRYAARSHFWKLKNKIYRRSY